jgi:hypothetical protein
MKNKILFVMLAIALVLGMTLAGCKDKEDGGSEATLEGTWLMAAASMGYSDYYFTFTGSEFTHERKNAAGTTTATYNGTFTSTATEITFIPESDDYSFDTFTQGYTLSRNKLMLTQVEGALLSPLEKKFRITYEIMAKHTSDPEGAFAGNFKYITRGTMAIDFSWEEQINFIGTLKNCASSSDEHAWLFVLNLYVGNSFSIENWYGLAPNGVITKYIINFDRESLEASWKM